jgi:facilitated trehalose transporter
MSDKQRFVLNSKFLYLYFLQISECASPRIRGTLSSFTASALALGILVAYIIGAFVEWWELAFILSIFPMLLFTGMIFMPETPVWLISHNREDDAKKALRRLRGKYVFKLFSLIIQFVLNT